MEHGIGKGGPSTGSEHEGLELRLGPIDYVLFGLTLFPSLFALMFVTSSGVHFLQNVRGRRLLMLSFIVVEALLVWAMVEYART